VGRETALCFESKERLGEVYVLHLGYAICSFVQIGNQSDFAVLFSVRVSRK
jgi:hypothetical protein